MNRHGLRRKVIRHVRDSGFILGSVSLIVEEREDHVRLDVRGSRRELLDFLFPLQGASLSRTYSPANFGMKNTGEVVQEIESIATYLGVR